MEEKKIKFFNFNEIGNITFINLYNKYNTSIFFPELMIKCDNDTTIVCDYIHPQFNELLKFVYDFYLKNKDDIIVFGDFNDDLVNKALNVFDVSYDEYININDIHIEFWKNYIWFIIEKILYQFNPNDEFLYKGIDSFKNKAVLHYANSNEEKSVVININKKDNGLEFKFSFLEDVVLPIHGKITCRYGSIILTYHSSLNQLNDSFVFVIDDFGFNDISENRVINNLANEDEISNINYYLELAGLKSVNEVSKFMDNDYLIFNFNQVDGEECEIISGHVIIEDEQVYIAYKEEYGLSNFQHYLFTPINGYEVIVKITPCESKCLIEYEYLPTKVTLGEYKNKIMNRKYKKLVDTNNFSMKKVKR